MLADINLFDFSLLQPLVWAVLALMFRKEIKETLKLIPYWLKERILESRDRRKESQERRLETYEKRIFTKAKRKKLERELEKIPLESGSQSSVQLDAHSMQQLLRVEFECMGSNAEQSAYPVTHQFCSRAELLFIGNADCRNGLLIVSGE